MIRSFYSGNHHILTPDDLEFLQAIFDEEINARGLDCDCEEAQAVAVRLVELFQAGVRDPDNLRGILKAA